MKADAIMVTGLGVSCALGSGRDALWQAMLAGRPVVHDWCLAAQDGRSVKTARMVFDEPGPDVPEAVPEYVRAGHDALAEAIRHAGLVDTSLDDAGLILGTTSGGTMDDFVEAAQAAEPCRHDCLGASAGIGSSTAWLADRFGIGGPTATVSAACTSSSAAIAQGMSLIRHGLCDVVIAGGSDRLRAADAGGFGVLRAVTRSACRPFDARRDGMLPGDGAAFLVLESASHARARGASPLAELVAAGFSADAHHATAPHPEGVVRAMRAALAQAGIDAGRVGYVNCHGTGTVLNDRNEAAALRQMFGDGLPDLFATSTKSVTGHLLGSAGALEALICVLVLQEQTVPPMRTVSELDPCVGFKAPIREAHRWAGASPLDFVMSNSLGFGGVNTSLILRRTASA